MPFPGGCIIGMRPIDIHITSLGKMGAVFEETDGMLCAVTDGLYGTRIQVSVPRKMSFLRLFMPEGVPGLKTVQKNRKLQNFADFCVKKVQRSKERELPVSW